MSGGFIMARSRIWTPKTRCVCGNTAYWDDETDGQTGTAWVSCRKCGRKFLASAKGYIDWSAGMLISSRSVVGSEFTQELSEDVFVNLSDLTDGL